MTYLDFQREANKRTTSWGRADPRAALIEQIDPITFRVMLPDGNTYHRARYSRDNGVFRGFCDCKGFEFRDRDENPCAHLCTLRKAEGLEVHDAITDVNGQPIEASDSDELEKEPDKRAVADGGEVVEPPASGHDGRVFGRPEMRR